MIMDNNQGKEWRRAIWRDRRKSSIIIPEESIVFFVFQAIVVFEL